MQWPITLQQNIVLESLDGVKTFQEWIIGFLLSFARFYLWNGELPTYLMCSI